MIPEFKAIVDSSALLKVTELRGFQMKPASWNSSPFRDIGIKISNSFKHLYWHFTFGDEEKCLYLILFSSVSYVQCIYIDIYIYVCVYIYIYIYSQKIVLERATKCVREFGEAEIDIWRSLK